MSRTIRSLLLRTALFDGDTKMRFRSYPMQAAQAQMVAMQQQMMALQHVALASARAMPIPQPVGFAMAPWAMPEPVPVTVPARPPAPSAAPGDTRGAGRAQPGNQGLTRFTPFAFHIATAGTRRRIFHCRASIRPASGQYCA
ncbi:hypothetical protein [Burkholderia sp. D-99]|uniref:hypothetical protein n=1 Tax=Burkholderia sp. D-99 TaxID=2717316 RepID=UPI00387EAEB7